MSIQESLILFIFVAKKLRLLKVSMSLRSPLENVNEFCKSRDWSAKATKIEHIFQGQTCLQNLNN